MIDYELTAEQKEFGRHMQRLCREEIAPGASALAYGTEEAIRGFLPGQLQKLAAGKYLDIIVAGDFVTACVAGEELAKSCPSTFLAAMSSGTAFGRTVAVFGSDAQRARYAEAIKKGEIIGAVACTEASGGSDIGGIVTTARR
ncbi:MAG: acyl-CoA dehydrogenase family protein, partial [Syntrophales bacterium]|nr:acyl-CoA dehydrogenase family protein [Syntrophales bacterium]